MKNALASLSLLAVFSLAACGSDSSTPSTATDCSKVTNSYDNYGKKFVEDYCASCHGADVKGDDRCAGPMDNPCSARAPDTYTFSTLEEITAQKDEIIGVVGNKSMPYNAPASVTDAQRAEFIQWLDCGPK